MTSADLSGKVGIGTWATRAAFRNLKVKAIAALRPPVIRRPGGCFASSYRRKRGIRPRDERLPHPRQIWDDLDVYSFGGDDSG